MTATTEWDQAARRWTIDVPDQRPDLDVAATIRAGVDHIRNNGGGLVHLWIHGVDDATDQAAVAAGFEAHRDLWQLRCPLPAEPSPLETRAFTPADTEALIGVNNRAFSWHPEQSGMTSESLAATMREPWYEPEGFRLYEVEGELKGFCWTKVHSDHDPVLGEIFVIAVDPSMHGKGLGSPMTRAGLDWLAARGIEHGMLYVESDNAPANRTYEKIGFHRHRTDRAYHRTVEPSS